MKILTNITDTDFLESPISLKELDSTEFEKLIFYLIDEMGFSDISWRKGGEGNTATDGGRDIEASYWRIEPIGTIEEKYWFEIKFRSQQLNKHTVQEIVYNAVGINNLDHLVIVTNSTISNNCLDWIKNSQINYKNLKISIWQGHDIELFLRKNPKTLAQFFASHLNQSGKLKVIESKFLNFFQLPSGLDLQELWNCREQLIKDRKYLLIFGAILGELERDRITEHNWGIYLNQETRFILTSLSIYNTIPFTIKMRDSNRNEEILVKGLSYLMQCILLKDSVKLAYKALMHNEEFTEASHKKPLDLKHNEVEAVVNYILRDLAIRCSKGCLKLSYGLDEETEIKPYFARFLDDIVERKTEDVFLVIQSKENKCEINLLSTEQICPLGEDFDFKENEEKDIYALLSFISNVLRKRVENYSQDI